MFSRVYLHRQVISEGLKNIAEKKYRSIVLIMGTMASIILAQLWLRNVDIFKLWIALGHRQLIQ